MKQAWAWRVQQSATPSLEDLSGVPEKDLAVAWFGDRDKLTYLAIGGRSLTGATLELKVDQEAFNANVEEAELQACLILERWKPDKPMAWDERPLTDCNLAAPATYERSMEAFVVDLTPLARDLSSPIVHGVSIVPVDEPASQFQVVFKGGRSVVVHETSGDEPEFDPPGGSSGSGGDAGVTNEPAPPPTDFSAPATGSVDPPPLQSEELPPQSDAADPVAAEAAPAAAEGDPMTFTWVYAGLMAVAVFPFITRVLAYSLPKGTSKGKRR